MADFTSEEILAKLASRSHSTSAFDKPPKLAERRNCPKCSEELMIRRGIFGKFIGCSGFPKCKHTERIQRKTGLDCPDCGRNMDIFEKKCKMRICNHGPVNC